MMLRIADLAGAEKSLFGAVPFFSTAAMFFLDRNARQY